jgi:hypothetical protein
MYYDSTTFFNRQHVLSKIVLTLPIYKKLRTNTRKKAGYLDTLALSLLTEKDAFLIYPKYIGKLVKKKKTALKRQERIRNLFYKTHMDNQHIFSILRNIVYPKIYLKNIDILYKQKDSLASIKKHFFYKKKKKKFTRIKSKRYFSYKFPTKIIDFTFLSIYESIFHSLLNLQIHVNI